MLEVKTYKNQEELFEAIQWDGSEERAITIVNWVLTYWGVAKYIPEDETTTAHIIVSTPDGPQNLLEGDYMVRGSRREFYPCKPNLFEQTYTEV